MQLQTHRIIKRYDIYSGKKKKKKIRHIYIYIYTYYAGDKTVHRPREEATTR